MSQPFVPPRMKERCQCFCARISASDVRSLMKIAAIATQREVAGNRLAAVLLRQDVIDREAIKEIIVLVHVAVFATTTSTFQNSFPK